MSVQRDTFIFYRSFRDALDDLPDDVRGRLYKAIADYALDQIEPNFPIGVESAVWKLIEPQLKANMKKYIASLKGGNPNLKRRNDTSNGLTNDTSNGLTITPTIPQPNDKCIMNNDKGVMNNAKDKPSIQLSSSKAEDNSSTFENVDSESEPSEPQKVPLKKKNDFDFVAFAKFYNDEMDKAGATIRRVGKINGRRMEYIRSRAREYSKEDLAIVVRKAAASDFLNGKNKKGWKADFTWIFRPNNFPKILEGNYDNETKYPNNSAGTLKQWTGGQCAASGQGTKAEFNAEALKRSEFAVARVVQGVDEPKPDF